MSVKELLTPSTQNAEWAQVYCNTFNTDNLTVAGDIGADNITLIGDLNADNVIATGTVEGNDVAANGASGLLNGKNLLLGVDDNTVTWSAGGDDAIAANALKGQLIINVASLNIAAGETYQIRWQNAAIEGSHRVFLFPKYIDANLTDAERLVINSQLAYASSASSNEAIIEFKNVSTTELGDINPTHGFPAGATLVYNVLIC